MTRLVTVLATLLALAACREAPEEPRRAATYCDHGNRIYTGKGMTPEGLAVVPQDPTCKEGS